MTRLMGSALYLGTLVAVMQDDAGSKVLSLSS